MTRNGMATADITVVGGGVVGVCVALELARRGASVVLLERGPELAWGCSAGNAGIVGSSHVLPLADPAAVRDGIRWMLRPDSPFFVRPRPRVLPWLMRFAAAASPPRVRRHREVLHELAAHSAVLHAELAEEGLDTGYRRSGLLNLYRSERAFSQARAALPSPGTGGPYVVDELPAGSRHPRSPGRSSIRPRRIATRAGSSMPSASSPRRRASTSVPASRCSACAAAARGSTRCGRRRATCRRTRWWWPRASGAPASLATSASGSRSRAPRAITSTSRRGPAIRSCRSGCTRAGS